MLDIDLNVKIDKTGVKLEVKKINPNGFIIDKVFKKLDKKSKKKEEEKELPAISEKNIADNTSDCYTIVINA